MLKPAGSMFVNLGDKYAGDSKWGGQSGHRHPPDRDGTRRVGPPMAYRARRQSGFPFKSLMGIPWRYAIGCIDELGLILRAELVWCLSGGARVYARTATGDRPIMLRDLYRAYRPEDVQLWNGQRWTQVLGWNRTPDDAGALEVELRTGERIGCTPGHRWPTRRGVLRADELRIGDVIDTVRLPEPAQPRTPEFLPDDDIGWLVGLYLAEGSRSERMVQIAGHARETARHARLTRIATALDGRAGVYQTSENGATCNLSGAVVRGVLDRYVSAGTAHTKRLRKNAWQRSDRFLTAVVEGYLSGDGHYDAKNDRWRLGFCGNDELAADLRTLAARLNAVCRLRRADHTLNGRIFPGWHGEWRWERPVHHNAKPDGEIVAIRRSRARDFYDVGVADEPHLFALASGVLTHNSKPNGLPESVTDRVRRAHETWFHLTKLPRYYSAVDVIREAQSSSPAPRRMGPGRNGTPRHEASADFTGWKDAVVAPNPLGKLPGSVWEVVTEPLTVPAELGVDHFAAFPLEWPRRLIEGWSPPGICTGCGEGRRPQVDVEKNTDAEMYGGDWNTRTAAGTVPSIRQRPRTIVGWTCACAEPTAPTTPAVVLDPFGGTGTTALAAHVLGRVGVTVDLSADYCRLAAWRTSDPGELARARRVPKPPVVHDDQGALW